MVQTTAGALYCGRQAGSSVLYCRRRYGPVSSRLLQVCYIVEGVVVQSAADYCRCVTLWKTMWSLWKTVINSRLLQVCYIVEGVVVQSTADYCRCVTLWKTMWSINSRLLQVCYSGGGGVIVQSTAGGKLRQGPQQKQRCCVQVAAASLTLCLANCDLSPQRCVNVYACPRLPITISWFMCFGSSYATQLQVMDKVVMVFARVRQASALLF